VARQLGRAIVIALGVSVALSLIGLTVGHLPMPEATRTRLLELALAPLFIASHIVTGVVDWFGPSGLPEPPSQYVPKWGVRAMMSAAVLIAFLALVGLALLSAKAGWRVGLGAILAIGGATSATEGYAVPIYPHSGASADTWLGSTVLVAATCLVVDGLARHSPGRHGLRLARQLVFACLLVAGLWLVYLLGR
jgi:hypothetical protein